MSEKQGDSQQPSKAENRPIEAAARIVESADLLRGSREIQIVHGDEIYRLRLTRNGKLILTK